MYVSDVSTVDNAFNRSTNLSIQSSSKVEIFMQLKLTVTHTKVAISALILMFGNLSYPVTLFVPISVFLFVSVSIQRNTTTYIVIRCFVFG